MAIPIRGQKMEYEKVEVDNWVEGTIDEVQFRVNENRRYRDKETGEYVTKTANEVRFAFVFPDYKFRHYSRWMTASMNKESNLYKKYLKELVEGLEPETDIDLEKMKGKKVKIMWKNDKGKNGEIYQSVAQIRGLDQITVDDLQISDEAEAEEIFQEE